MTQNYATHIVIAETVGLGRRKYATFNKRTHCSTDIGFFPHRILRWRENHAKHQNPKIHRAKVAMKGAEADLRREREWVRSHIAENSSPLWSRHLVPQSDETWLPEWSDGLVELSGARSPVAWVSWVKPVFRLAGVKSKLAGSLAWGRVQFTRRASTQAKSRPGRRGMKAAMFGCDFRLTGLITLIH